LFLTVVHTYTEQADEPVVRIISARRATPHERNFMLKRFSGAFVNLIWPLLILSFGPTWASICLPQQTPLLNSVL